MNLLEADRDVEITEWVRHFRVVKRHEKDGYILVLSAPDGGSVFWSDTQESLTEEEAWAKLPERYHLHHAHFNPPIYEETS